MESILPLRDLCVARRINPDMKYSVDGTDKELIVRTGVHDLPPAVAVIEEVGSGVQWLERGDLVVFPRLAGEPLDDKTEIVSEQATLAVLIISR